MGRPPRLRAKARWVCPAITPFHGFRTRSRRPNIEHYPDGPDPPRDHDPVCRFVGAGDPGPRGLWSLGEGTMASGEPGDARTRVGGIDEKGGRAMRANSDQLKGRAKEGAG